MMGPTDIGTSRGIAPSQKQMGMFCSLLPEFSCARPVTVESHLGAARFLHTHKSPCPAQGTTCGNRLRKRTQQRARPQLLPPTSSGEQRRLLESGNVFGIRYIVSSWLMLQSFWSRIRVCEVHDDQSRRQKFIFFLSGCPSFSAKINTPHLSMAATFGTASTETSDPYAFCLTAYRPIMTG